MACNVNNDCSTLATRCLLVNPYDVVSFPFSMSVLCKCVVHTFRIKLPINYVILCYLYGEGKIVKSQEYVVQMV